MRTVYLKATKASIEDNIEPDDLSTWVLKQCEEHPQTGHATYLRMVGY